MLDSSEMILIFIYFNIYAVSVETMYVLGAPIIVHLNMVAVF